MVARNIIRIVGVAAVVALVAPAAEARPLRSLGTAVAVSVDGPGQLTLKVGGRVLVVRLHAVDVPREGECGAAETTAALRGFVRRAPSKLRYALVRTSSGFQRDASGRFSAVLAYRGSRNWRDLGNDLLKSGWGRVGETVTGADGQRTLGRLPEGARGAGRQGRAGRAGVWALCGGRVHLPVGEPVQASSAPVWNVDELGIAKSIGPLTLSATLTPSSTLTLGGLGATAPTEYTYWAFGCKASVPSLQLEAWATAFAGPCAGAPVLLLRPSGPDPARLSRGGGIGLPVNQTQAGYPLLNLDEPAGWLSGTRRLWAWQVAAETGEGSEPIVTDLLAYQAALGRAG